MRGLQGYVFQPFVPKQVEDSVYTAPLPNSLKIHCLPKNTMNTSGLVSDSLLCEQKAAQLNTLVFKALEYGVVARSVLSQQPWGKKTTTSIMLQHCPSSQDYKVVLV